MQVIGTGKCTYISVRHVHICPSVLYMLDLMWLFSSKTKRMSKDGGVRACLTTSTCDFDDSVGALRRRKKNLFLIQHQPRTKAL